MLNPVWHRKLKRIVYMKDKEEILVTNMSKEQSPMTPEQIYDYMHEEHTPYASMTADEGREHICELMRNYAKGMIEQSKQPIKIISDSGGVRFA